MKYLKLFLAFGCGWATVIALGLGADAAGQRGKPAGNAGQSASLQSRISALVQRVSQLEQAAVSGKLNKKVVAPFEVVDQADQRVFYVGPDRDVEFYQGNKRAAVMSAAGGVGTFFALSGSSQSWTALSSERMTVNENGQTRMSLGKSAAHGNYMLDFSSGSHDIAKIGVSYETNAGSALVFDQSGYRRVAIAAADGKGVITVLRGDALPIAQLTEGKSKGGRLLTCSADGCDPPMVDAGDAGGYGIVWTGPQSYNPGVGLMGAPGSFIMGKH